MVGKMSFLPDVNVSKIAGTATAVNAGANSAGVQRVTIATDDAPTTETHGTKAAGTAAAKSDLVGMVAASAAPAPTNGQQIALQGDLLGCLRVNPAGQTGSFTSLISNPTAGTNLNFAIPAGFKVRVKAIKVRLVTSSQSATRQMRIFVGDAAGVLLARKTPITAVNTPYSQAASLTKDYIFGPNMGDSDYDTANEIYIGFPELSLGPGATIQTTVTNLQSGDVINFAACVEEYSD
jgi:hypothetical protein